MFSLPGNRVLHGIEGSIEVFRQTLKPGVSVSTTVQHQICNGAIVMNKRTETSSWSGGQLILKIAGIFQAKDGLVARWTDYNHK